MPALAWTWPVPPAAPVERFEVTGNPYAAGQHRGVTLAAPAGRVVVAACGGVVRWAGEVGTSGRGVTVGCGSLNATYTRLGGLLVEEGERVRPGTGVGTVGASGSFKLGARARAERHGYRDPLKLLGVPPAPPLGPAPRSIRPSPRLPRALPPEPVRAARPGVPPLGAWWVPAGLGLVGAVVLLGGGAGVARRLGRSATRDPSRWSPRTQRVRR